MNFNQVIDSLDKGLFEKTMEIADQFDFNTKNCIIIHCLLQKSQFNLAEIRFKEFQSQFKPENKFDKLKFSAIKNELLYRLYQYDQLEISLSEVQALITTLSFELPEHHFWHYIVTLVNAYYFHIKGSYHEAINTYVKMLRIAETIGMVGAGGSAYGLIGEVYSEIGDFEKALESYKLALNRFQRVNNSIDSAYVHLYIGMIHEKRGDFNEAKISYKLSLSEFSKSDAPHEAYKTKMRLGYLILLQGEVDNAVDIFNDLHPFVIEQGYLYQEAELNHFMGTANMIKFQYMDAIDNFTKAMELRKPSENPIELSHILFHLLNASIFAGKKDLVDKYFTELKLLSENNDNPTIKLRKNLIEASILKDAPRLSEKVKAQQIYEQIVNDSTVEEFQIKIIALINLCELLVFEIKNSNDENLLNEAYGFIDRIQQQAESLNSSSLSLEAKLLKAKFYQCEFKFTEAINLLETSIAESKKMGLKELEGKLSAQLSSIFTELEKWNNLSDGGKNLKKRIEQIEVKEYLNDLNKILRSK